MMFNQVSAKGRIQAGKITGDDTPEGICSDRGILYMVEPK